MKILGKTLLVLLAVIILLSMAAFLLPRTAHVERTVQIEAPARMIFSQVNDLHQWGKWAPWNQIDPDMSVEYQNSGIGEGAGYTWESQNKQVGRGSLVINVSVPYDSISISMDFMEGGVANSYFVFKEDGSKTAVTWGFNSDLGNNPLARWVGLMFNQMIGADFDKGLNNLSQFCQTMKEEEIPVIEIVELPEIHYASLSQNVNWENVGSEMGAMFGKINSALQRENILITDMPFVIYHSMDEGNMQIECGIPVEKSFEPVSGISSQIRKTAKYAIAYHIGGYENLEKTHSALQDWIKEHKFSVSGGPMEIYLTDQASEPDVNKWITAVYYPL